MSSRSAPAPASSLATCTISSSLPARPSPEKLSGVTLRMPTMDVRLPHAGAKSVKSFLRTLEHVKQHDSVCYRSHSPRNRRYRGCLLAHSRKVDVPDNAGGIEVDTDVNDDGSFAN